MEYNEITFRGSDHLMNIVIAVIFEKLELKAQSKELGKDEMIFRSAAEDFLEGW